MTGSSGAQKGRLCPVMWPWRALTIYIKTWAPGPAHTSSSTLQTYPKAPLPTRKSPSVARATQSLGFCEREQLLAGPERSPPRAVGSGGVPLLGAPSPGPSTQCSPCFLKFLGCAQLSLSFLSLSLLGPETIEWFAFLPQQPLPPPVLHLGHCRWLPTSRCRL